MKAIYPIWILISDSSKARLFTVDSEHRPMILREAFEHTASRSIEHQLVTDKPIPQSHDRPHSGHGNRSDMEAHTSAKTLEHRRFAHTLADSLNSHCSRNDYARLILAAAPEFLGILRDNLNDHVKKNIVASLHKNYTNLNEKELEQHLGPLLAA
jgi:protein required for attachment to host cells